ncbi:MAG: glycosyltransferase, partial [Candidatus Methylomirabilales bacterium]
LPVVATKAASIPEVLADGEAGYLVEPSSGASLAAGIEKVLLDRELQSRLVKAGRERARDYSVEAMLQKIEAVYQDVLGNKNGMG